MDMTNVLHVIILSKNVYPQKLSGNCVYCIILCTLHVHAVIFCPSPNIKLPFILTRLQVQLTTCRICDRLWENPAKVIFFRCQCLCVLLIYHMQNILCKGHHSISNILWVVTFWKFCLLKPHCILSSRVLVPASTSKSTLRRMQWRCDVVFNNAYWRLWTRFECTDVINLEMTASNTVWLLILMTLGAF
jgi:hypothetical protein